MPKRNALSSKIADLEAEVKRLRSLGQTKREPIKGFGGWLQSKREALSLGVRQFALMCGLNPSMISRIEKLTAPDVEFVTMKCLAKGLKMEPWQFVKACMEEAQ